MQVLHGKIYDVHGDMKWRGDIGFVNATVSLSGNSWGLDCQLRRDFPDLPLPLEVKRLARDGIDAIWIIGRIKAFFGSWIELNFEGEKSILDEGFGAYFKTLDVCIPFVLTDYYLRTSFLFGSSLTDDSLKRKIAMAFYEMLFEPPHDLVDFEFRKDHIGSGATMVGGVVNGQVQYDEEH